MPTRKIGIYRTIRTKKDRGFHHDLFRFSFSGFLASVFGVSGPRFSGLQGPRFWSFRPLFWGSLDLVRPIQPFSSVLPDPSSALPDPSSALSASLFGPPCRSALLPLRPLPAPPEIIWRAGRQVPPQQASRPVPPSSTRQPESRPAALRPEPPSQVPAPEEPWHPWQSPSCSRQPSCCP